jgi:PKD repeat protein
VTPDYAGTAAMGTYTVTDFAPAFTVNGSTSGPITAITNQNLTVSNSSQRGATVTASGGYWYSLCLIPCTPPTDAYTLWATMGDAPPGGSPPTTATIPLPAIAGNYSLKIKVNYTGGQWAYWPDPAGTAYFPLNVVSVVPLVVTASVSPATAAAGQNVTFSCSATGGLAPYSYQWHSSVPFAIPGATQPTYQTTSTVPGNVVAYCYVTDSESPTPKSSSDYATATFTGGSPVSVNVTASTNNTPVNTTVYFTCSASGGGGGPFNYAWSGNAVSGTGPNASQTFTAAGTYNAVCTATDSVTGGAGIGSTSVVVTGGGGGGNLSVNASVSPNPASVNQTVTFSCNVSGGSPPYTYQWRSPSTSSFVAGRSQTFQTSSPTPISIQAGCTATDSAGASSANAATVTINDVVAPPAACVDVNYTILDRDSGISIPLSSALGIQYFGVAVGQNLTFLATGTGINTADWTFGDGGTASNTNPAWYTYTTAGTFNATVTLNSNASCSKAYKFIVAGPSGLFTASYADGSVFSSTNVESGKALSFLATDTANSYAWDFGDGNTATGKNPTHAFTVSGSTNVTFTTTLTVTIGTTHGSTSQTFTVIPPPEPPKWFVAGVAYLPGAIAGTLWQTDFTILNPDPTRPGTYSLAFLDGRNPVDPANLVWKTINLGPQQSISSPNVLAFFGQPLGSYGALLVRGDVAPVAPVTTSRTFNNGDPTKGTFGLSVPSTQASSGVSPQASPAQQFLIGLRDDGTAYTNIALVNLVSTDWSHAHLTFFDATGANLGLLNLSVPPYGVAQLTRPLTGGGGLALPKQDLYSVQVTVDAGGSVYPYATVIDSTSTDPIAVTPTPQPSSTYRVPGIVRAPGANGTVWRSRFFLHNPSLSARSVNLLYSYVPCVAAVCGGRSSTGQDVSLAPGETKSWDDFPAAWLTGPGSTVSDSVTYGDSFIDVSPSTGDSNVDPLLVLGETFNLQPTGPVGLELPGFTDLDAGSKTSAGKRLVLAGLESDNAFRTNVAFFLTSGASGYFKVHVISDTGVELKSFGWNLAASSPFKQFSDTDLFGDLANKPARITIIVDSLDGSPVAAYATIIDNTSGAATFVKAQTGP